MKLNSLDSDKKKKFSFSWLIIILIIFGTVGELGYLLWKKYDLPKKIAVLENRNKTKEEKIRQLGKTENTSSKWKAHQVLKKAENYRVEWSKILAKILEVENKDVKIINFSSTKDQKISASGKATDWDAISNFIENLNANPKIQNIFVSSVSKDKELDKKSKKTHNVSFQITFNFIEK